MAGPHAGVVAAASPRRRLRGKSSLVAGLAPGAASAGADGAGQGDVIPPAGPEAADVPTEDSSSSSSSDSESEWIANEGVTSDEDEETPAAPKLRGQAALVTAACPRRYLRLAAERKERGVFIPEDFSMEEFLRSFRRVWDANTTVALEKATCHDEPHKRWRRSMDRRERHKHIALLAGATFAHKKIADAFQCKYGLRRSFSFKHLRFGGYLRYLMVPGKKPSSDLDVAPAKYPTTLDLSKELTVAPHPTSSTAGQWPVLDAGRLRRRRFSLLA